MKYKEIFTFLYWIVNSSLYFFIVYVIKLIKIKKKEENTILQLKSIEYIKKYINDKLVEERYFISNIDSKYVEQLSKVIRSEWQIENNLH